MIAIDNITKRFHGHTALKGLDCVIENGTIYGLIGPNGAGKSTLLRLIAGVYCCEEGKITIDGQPVYENIAVKNQVFFLSDELYFLPQSSMDSMADFYAGYYSNFSYEVYRKLCGVFLLDTKKRIGQFSKGMQRQAGLILAISCCPRILLLDEAFDGLDPVVRHLIRKILIDNAAKHSNIVIISSQNLRELEDLCDHIGLIYRGGILFDRDIDSLKLDLSKFHCAFKQAPPLEDFQTLDLVKIKKQGNFITFTARGSRSEIEQFVGGFEPVFFETIPLTLEEVFIQEMEVAGYGFDDIERQKIW